MLCQTVGISGWNREWLEHMKLAADVYIYITLCSHTAGHLKSELFWDLKYEITCFNDWLDKSVAVCVCDLLNPKSARNSNSSYGKGRQEGQCDRCLEADISEDEGRRSCSAWWTFFCHFKPLFLVHSVQCWYWSTEPNMLLVYMYRASFTSRGI